MNRFTIGVLGTIIKYRKTTLSRAGHVGIPNEFNLQKFTELIYVVRQRSQRSVYEKTAFNSGDPGGRIHDDLYL